MSSRGLYRRYLTFQTLTTPLVVGLLLLFYCSDSIAGQSSMNQQKQNKLLAAPVRAIHIISKGLSPDEMKRLIDKAAAARFNVLILGIGWRGSTKLDSMPWASGKEAWNRAQLLDVVNYARSKSIEVVPNVPLLTHQSLFLENSHPELLFNAETYDPRKPEVYELVFGVLDEVIDLLRPKAIHIGHDELFGSPNRPKHWRAGEQLLPANLFRLDVQRIRDHLASREVETWIWGDMLISQEELPGMNKGYLLGGIPGYGAALRRQLPKDIVICDWHYNEKSDEFKSIDALKRDGFRVLGSTFDDDNTTRNFSRYASNHGADGMIATTWFHVQKKKWDIVDQIIRESGKAFLKDFPDGRKP